MEDSTWKHEPEADALGWTVLGVPPVNLILDRALKLTRDRTTLSFLLARRKKESVSDLAYYCIIVTLQTQLGIMRVSSYALTLVLLANAGDAFRPLNIQTSTRPTHLLAQNKLLEFDYLLGENTQFSNGQQQVQSRRRIYLNDERSTVLASTTFAQPGTEEETLYDDADPYAEIGLEEAAPQLEKIQREQTISEKIESKLKTMDLQDIVSTLIIPSIALFAGGRWVYNRAANRVGESLDEVLDKFASEMIYHDADFEEMKLCHGDYSKKLMVMGPRKTQAMLKRYLQLYAKKRTVSPQAIRYVPSKQTLQQYCPYFALSDHSNNFVSSFIIPTRVSTVDCVNTVPSPMSLVSSNSRKRKLLRSWSHCAETWVMKK